MPVFEIHDHVQPYYFPARLSRNFAIHSWSWRLWRTTRRPARVRTLAVPPAVGMKQSQRSGTLGRLGGGVRGHQMI